MPQTCHSPTPVAQFDVVISGGGMTGAMLAYRLLTQANARPLRIAIIEQTAAATDDAKPTASFDSRSIALSAASVELLSDWGLWRDLAAHACAIEQIEVSDRGHIGKTYLNALDYRRDALGFVIEIEWIGDCLYQKLQPFSQGELPRLTWLRPDALTQLTQHLSQLELTLQSGATLSTQLLVLAEGGDSPSRALVGIDCRRDDYHQTALIANIGLRASASHSKQAAHQHKAYERFTSDGPMALLPLTQHRFSLVWTTTPERASELQQLPNAEFLAKLQQEFGYRAGEFISVGNRVVYPLQLKQAVQASAHRVVLAGNSLHSLHPIAGQGFNLALRDLQALCQLVQQQVDVGSYALTSHYQKLRQSDMQQTVWLTDALVRLFSNNSKLVAFGRTLGLTLLNHLIPLKAAFAAQTMGLTPLRAQQQHIQPQRAQVAPLSSNEPNLSEPSFSGSSTRERLTSELSPSELSTRKLSPSEMP